MACRERQTALQEYAAGELAPEPARRLEAHLEGCSDCARDLAAYRSLQAALHALPEPATPPDLHAQLCAALAPHVAVARRRRERSLQATARRTAAVLVATAFGVSLSVALWGWLGRIASFAAGRFTQDLAAFWTTAKDLWYLLGLLAEVVRTLEPTAGSLWNLGRQAAAPIVEWGALILIGYALALALGGWLCWRALHQREERSLSHAA
jgi:predicted anti-sigma-YlaC factor YlaD